MAQNVSSPPTVHVTDLLPSFTAYVTKTTFRIVQFKIGSACENLPLDLCVHLREQKKMPRKYNDQNNTSRKSIQTMTDCNAKSVLTYFYLEIPEMSTWQTAQIQIRRHRMRRLIRK